jgi:hypothetical protein
MEKQIEAIMFGIMVATITAALIGIVSIYAINNI